jgi:uncharacterized metal-binding protein
MSQETQILVEARAAYDEQETRKLAQVAARTEAAGYCKQPRVEEIMHFARSLGVKRLGIASRVGLLSEARLLQEILEANGFEVLSLCCKVGSIPKEDIGLNVAVGLCVGHNSLFFQHSQAPVTVLVAKDRVTGHNPVAALYTSHSYYRRLRG